MITIIFVMILFLFITDKIRKIETDKYLDLFKNSQYKPSKYELFKIDCKYIFYGYIIGLIIAIILPTKTHETFIESYNLNKINGSNSICDCAPYIIKDHSLYDLQLISEDENNPKGMSIQISKSIIIYSDVTPRVEKYLISSDDEWYNWFSIDSDEYKYVIYTPKNSKIIDNYYITL